MKNLEGNIAILTLSNSLSLVIQPNNTGESVFYQFHGNEVEEIKEAEIEYIKHEDNEEEYVPAFKIEFDNGEEKYYYIQDFLKV